MKLNFKPENLTKDVVLTLLGIVLALSVVSISFFLVIKEKATIEQIGSFLGIVLPIIITLFSLAGRNN